MLTCLKTVWQKQHLWAFSFLLGREVSLRNTDVPVRFGGQLQVLQAGQRNGIPLPELLGFEPSVVAVAATASPSSLAASVLLSPAFAGGQSLALQSDRPVKSHTLGVNLAPWGVLPQRFPQLRQGLVPSLSLSAVLGLRAVAAAACLCLAATAKLHHAQGLEKWQASA